MNVGDLVKPLAEFPGDDYYGLVVQKVDRPGSSVRKPRDVVVMWEDGNIFDYDSTNLRVINESR